MTVLLDTKELIKPKVVVVTSGSTIFLYLLFFYLHPENHGWWLHPKFSILHTLQFVLIDQVLIECISVLITYWLLDKYMQVFRLKGVELDMLFLIKRSFQLIPFALLIFFFFNPFTQTTRFIYNNLLSLNWTLYFDEYWYNKNNYLTYISLSFLWTFGGFYYLLSRQSLLSIRRKKELTFLKGYTDEGDVLIDIEKILYIKRVNRRNEIITDRITYNGQSLVELEKELPHNFIRINRSVILRVDQIKSYSYWENDKYVLKTTLATEFTVSRLRLKEIKNKLGI